MSPNALLCLDTISGMNLKEESHNTPTLACTLTVCVTFILPRLADCCVSSHLPPVPFKYKYLRIAYL